MVDIFLGQLGNRFFPGVSAFFFLAESFLVFTIRIRVEGKEERKKETGKKGGTGWEGQGERQQPFEHQQLHRSPPQLAASSICSSYILRGIVWSRRGYTHRLRPERTKEIKNIFLGVFGGCRNELFPSFGYLVTANTGQTVLCTS